MKTERERNVIEREKRQGIELTVRGVIEVAVLILVIISRSSQRHTRSVKRSVFFF